MTDFTSFYYIFSIGCMWVFLVGVGAVDDPRKNIK